MTPKTLDEVARARLERADETEAKLAISERDLDLVLDYVKRQGGYLSGPDVEMLRGVRVRREQRR